MQSVPRHQCLIYEGSPALQLPGLAAIAIEKLKANSRCLFLNSPAMVAGFRSYVAAGGVDVAEEVKRGALILSSDQHLKNGLFDVDGMLRLLQDAVDQALKDRYAGLWASGDMMWEFGSEKNLNKLLEYECALENLFQGQSSLTGLCQYHKDILPITAIQVALYTHPSVFINQTLSRMNPFYTRPDTLQTQNAGTPAERVQTMITHLHASLNR